MPPAATVPSTCKHRCRDKQTCKHSCCKEKPGGPDVNTGTTPPVSPSLLTPAKKLSSTARDDLRQLTPAQRKDLLAELNDTLADADADDDSGTKDNTNEITTNNDHMTLAAAINQGHLRRDACNAITRLSQYPSILDAMDFFSMCGGQSDGDDYRPCVAAALSRSSNGATRKAAMSVSSSRDITKLIWKEVVKASLESIDSARFLAAARAEWAHLRQKSHEDVNTYHGRASTILDGYTYVALLMGRPVEEDTTDFTSKWIDGLNGNLRAAVSVYTGENPTMCEARKAARRLDRAQIQQGDDTTSQLKRKIEALENDIKSHKRPKPWDQDENLISFIGQSVNARFAQGFAPPPPLPINPPPGTRPPAEQSTFRSPYVVPIAEQACAKFFLSNKCTMANCKRSHSVPANLMPPKGCCYHHFYGKCTLPKCTFQHSARHPACPACPN